MSSLERTIGATLRVGVTAAAIVAGVGGVLYLLLHGSEPASFGAHDPIRPFGTSERIIALGIILLIATPILRVALLVVAFARARDAIYVILSAIVLTVLLVSLL